MSMNKTTYLMYGIVLPITPGGGAVKPLLGDTKHSLWDDEMLPYIEGHDSVACSLLYGEDPANKAYFGLVLARTTGRYETRETDVTGFWGDSNAAVITQAAQEMDWLLGKMPEPRLLMFDIVR